jgi:hemoglobin/transferrin/lactoferrin receptor protein
MMATIGSTADETAVSTGVPVTGLKSETSNNYDLSFRVHNRRIETDLTGFVIDYGNTIVRQTLILPPGAVGLRLGSEVIERQNANGAVFVPLSASPVLVQANFGGTRLKGIEYSLSVRVAGAWTAGGHYSVVRAEDRETGLPPNLGGAGVPPQTAFLTLRYQPGGDRRYWVEAYGVLAGRQNRLSSLDLSDRRTGATRSRTNIQNFFRRGACVRGLTTPGPTGCGSAGGILIATGETLAQVQDRVLGGAESAPLFAYIPGYGLINLRGGFRVNEQQRISIDFENIADKDHRMPGWGIDGPGRSLSIRYQYRF